MHGDRLYLLPSERRKESGRENGKERYQRAEADHDTKTLCRDAFILGNKTGQLES